MDPLTSWALLPGIIIIVYIYGKDKVEKEPISLIIRLVLFGALSCIPAIFLESYNMSVISVLPEKSVAFALAQAFFVAGLCEEFSKLILLRLGSWKHPSFNYRFDGIVYGVSVAVGFALLENLNYVYQYGMQVAIQRAFTAVPLHAFCGAMMGIFYSYSKKASIDGRRTTSMAYGFLSFFVPFIIHGTYDALLMLNNRLTYMLSFVLVIYLFITVICMVNRMSSEDRQGRF